MLGLVLERFIGTPPPVEVLQGHTRTLASKRPLRAGGTRPLGVVPRLTVNRETKWAFLFPSPTIRGRDTRRGAPPCRSRVPKERAAAAVGKRASVLPAPLPSPCCCCFVFVLPCPGECEGGSRARSSSSPTPPPPDRWALLLLLDWMRVSCSWGCRRRRRRIESVGSSSNL